VTEKGCVVDQPVFWSALLAVSVALVVVRLRRGAPLLTRFSRRTPVGALVVAAVAAVALVFHCGSMFFAPWVDAIPGLGGPAGAVRAMGTASQAAYWVPAALLVVMLGRLWWPAVLVIVVSLVGVGVTMFSPYPLTTHLVWLATATLTLVATATGLLDRGSGTPRRRTSAARATA